MNKSRAIIEGFERHIHHEIVRNLLILLAIILELPDDYFLSVHCYEKKSDCHLRYMKYHGRTEDENEKAASISVQRPYRLWQLDLTLPPASRCAAGSHSKRRVGVGQAVPGKEYGELRRLVSVPHQWLPQEQDTPRGRASAQSEGYRLAGGFVLCSTRE